MAKPPRYSEAELLDHIVELCDVTMKAVAGKSFEDFTLDRNLFDATAYRLQAIGEACAKLGEGTKAAHAIPWTDIVGMRHRLSHDYLALAPRIIWDAARSELGALRGACATERKDRSP